MKRLPCLLVVLFAGLSLAAGEPPPRLGHPHPRAHAHNDYEHQRPLLDALEHGFCGVEADVHLVEGELLVAHDPEEVRPGRTLEKLYLQPLWELARRHRGRVYPGGPSVTLLIDIKTDAARTYTQLVKTLEQYEIMLTRFEADHIQTNAVTVIISGNRPRELIRAEKSRLAAYDGRLSDLPANLPPSFAPLISDNWRNHFEWRGEGEFPKVEKQKLGELARQVHAQGKRIRFWAAPDQEVSWRVQIEAGVDLINTDRLAELSRFLAEKTGAPGSR